MRLLRVLMTVCLLAITLCACSTFIAYTGPEQQDSEVAHVETWFRYYVFVFYQGWIDSVDGKRPHTLLAHLTNSAKVPPGPHWFQVREEMKVGLGGGIRICALDMDVEAGHTYKFLAHTISSDAPSYHEERGKMYHGSIRVKITPPNGPSRIQQISTVCAHDYSGFCRSDADCNPPKTRCIPNDAYAFRLCGNPEMSLKDLP